jgi:Holliday junction resolvase RusA-like endonuclease/endogenous inhibitor of DNA gyrase (YacG/DUF329 family)
MTPRTRTLLLDWKLYADTADLPPLFQVVVGEPVSKSRPRVTRGGGTYTPAKTREAEALIAATVRAENPRLSARGDVCFGLQAEFRCGTWQRRDVDNMLKLVADALTGVVWADDSQVSEMSARVVRGVGPDNALTAFRVYQTDALMNPTAPCELCGVPVRQYKSQPNRFCSKAHSDEFQRERVDLTCLKCGTVYELPRARARRVKNPFCSEKCRYRAQTITRPCAQCGRPVTRPRSQTKGHSFCDKACSDAYKIGRPRGAGKTVTEL